MSVPAGCCHSLLIHVKSCQKKWTSQQEQQPKDKRRPLPPLPEELADQKDPSKLAASSEQASLPLTSAEIDAFNARMFSVFDRAALAVCKHCSRSFSDEAFVRHSKVCSAEKPFKPLKVDSSGCESHWARPHCVIDHVIASSRNCPIP